MKLNLAYVGTSISYYGFRIVAAIARQQAPDCGVYFFLTGNRRSLATVFKNSEDNDCIPHEDLHKFAAKLADADVVGLSCFTDHSDLVKDLIREIRECNPNIFVLWGGIHAIIDPDDAILHADAVCVSEGENAIAEFITAWRRGEDVAGIPNFWVRRNNVVTKAPLRPLLTGEELSQIPFPLYNENEVAFRPGKGFEPMQVVDHLDYDGLCYHTIWSRGCPFKCAYCSNNRFIDVDRDYARVRFSSVSHIIDEVKAIKEKFPHIRQVVFNDDCMLSLPIDVLTEFSLRWRGEIAIPFTMLGVTPAHINAQKLEILLEAGLNRVRMGIQSGSDRILTFYRRPNRPGLVKQAIGTLGAYSPHLALCVYDIIVDNPIETAADVHATIRLINGAPRPLTLALYSLKLIPNTELARKAEEMGVVIDDIRNSYSTLAPSWANCLLMVVMMVRLPEPILTYFLRFAKPAKDSRLIFGPLMALLKVAYYSDRFRQMIRHREFSAMFGRTFYSLWKMGILGAPPTPTFNKGHLDAVARGVGKDPMSCE